MLGTLHGTLKKGKIPLARGPPSPPTPDGIAASLPSWLRASVPYDKLSEPHTHRCWGCHQSNTTHTVQALSAECQGSRKQEGGNQRERWQTRKVLGHLLCFLKHDMTSHDKKTGLAPRVNEELARWPGGEILNWAENKWVGGSSHLKMFKAKHDLSCSAHMPKSREEEFWIRSSWHTWGTPPQAALIPLGTYT